MNDLASGTSSYATKLIHGGLRYLEYYEFRLVREAAGEPLAKGMFTKGFEYSDCFVDDARLVLLNALDAAARGAEIRTRTRATEVRRAGDAWQISVEDTLTGKRETIRARAVV